MVLQAETVYSLIQARNWYAKNEDLLSFRLPFEPNDVHRAGI